MASARPGRTLRTAPRQRVTRTKPGISYAESSSDNNDSAADETDEDTQSEVDGPPRPTRSLNAPKSQKNPKKRTRPSPRRLHDGDDSPIPRTSKKRKTSKPSTPKSIINDDLIKTSSVIPPWQTLPYHILVQIFRYATYPLYDEHTFQPLPSGRWLLSVARLCHGFAEPAFTVLYSSPPLVPMVQAHRLVDLLKENPMSMAFKYRQKVESLRIDVDQVAAHPLPGSGRLDLHGLIKDLPRLAELEFYHQMDMSPYRKLDDTIKWTYPKTIFDALEHVDPAADPGRGDKTGVSRLWSWRWSSRLAGKTWPIEMIPKIHLKPSFASLRKIAFVNYQIPLVKKDEEDPKHEHILAEALKNLKSLEHLIFESSTLLNPKLLPMLPTNLRNLELINCWEVVADDFAAFLLTHGSQLRCLTLNHNQFLSLSFLPVLGTACPKLQVFRANLTYFNIHATYRDSEPQYEQLLLPNEVPVWPSTLQCIELIQLRKWETEAAEMFFQSLLYSADNLLDLRRLTIQAILNIGWRDRASFRDKWVGSLGRVFKRVSEPPQILTSVIKPSSVRDAVTEQPKQEKSAPGPRRKSLRSSSISNVASASTSPTTVPQVIIDGRQKKNDSPPTRRSTRTSTRQLQKGMYAESPDNSDAEPEMEREQKFAAREAARQSRFAKELAVLEQTAAVDSPAHVSTPPKTPDGSESDNSTVVTGKGKGKGKEREVIQGMCDIVEVRIDNLRPTETQVTEADFLDEEISGDEDWDEDGDGDGDDGYAW